MKVKSGCIVSVRLPTRSLSFNDHNVDIGCGKRPRRSGAEKSRADDPQGHSLRPFFLTPARTEIAWRDGPAAKRAEHRCLEMRSLAAVAGRIDKR
jgi:hypothetical protein